MERNIDALALIGWNLGPSSVKDLRIVNFDKETNVSRQELGTSRIKGGSLKLSFY